MNQVPGLERLFRAHRPLLMGAGGGYDILGAVPLYAELQGRGVSADFASLSFSSLEALQGAVRDPEAECLYRVGPESATQDQYCPEAWLARWLSEAKADRPCVWGFRKVGVRPLRAALQVLTQRLGTDLLVLIDGGIDLTLRGDETSIGTPSEDLATLAAVAGLDLPALAMCIGFGAELREGIPHAQVLERFAHLQAAGACLGAVGLHPSSVAGSAYLDALGFVRRHQARQRGTHIHDVVAASMQGRFGGGSPDVWVSPLASLCWFFDVAGLASSHLFLSQLNETDTMWEVTSVIRGCRTALAIRPRTAIPI
jgi:hypothetical protein